MLNKYSNCFFGRLFSIMKHLFVTLIASIILLSTSACSGGGGGSSTPHVFLLSGSYYGTVVSNFNNSGNMGLTTDSAGNGNFAVQFPGRPSLSETFAPPVSSNNGGTLNVAGVIGLTGCNIMLTATAIDDNTAKGTYTLTCPGQSNVTATFTLPHGMYVTQSQHHMTVSTRP